MTNPHCGGRRRGRQTAESTGQGGGAGSVSLTNGGGGGAAARRKLVSVASASSASLGRRLEAIVEPDSLGRCSEGSSSSSFRRKVVRLRSVGCGSLSFSGDFLELLSTGFSDCALRRVESHREPKPKSSVGALAHLGGSHFVASNDDDNEYESTQQHRIKCTGFFGGLGVVPPPTSSSYWLFVPLRTLSSPATASSCFGFSMPARLAGVGKRQS
uniref:Uncharacterized protein n=1 Tax=Oryza meridionalis TaxID=40149 RepID=A0A0E0ERZ7_9ORYZ